MDFPASDPELMYDLARARLDRQLGVVDSIDAKLSGFFAAGSALLGIVAAIYAIRPSTFEWSGAAGVCAGTGACFGAGAAGFSSATRQTLLPAVPLRQVYYCPSLTGGNPLEMLGALMSPIRVLLVNAVLSAVPPLPVAARGTGRPQPPATGPGSSWCST
jgi:hypothetical protein